MTIELRKRWEGGVGWDGKGGEARRWWLEEVFRYEVRAAKQASKLESVF